MKVEITKIKVALKDRTIELTAEEARRLNSELNKLFSAEETKAGEDKKMNEIDKRLQDVERRPISIPMPIITQPIYIDRYVPWWPNYWQITCGGNTPLTDVNQYQSYGSLSELPHTANVTNATTLCMSLT
jgi:hypothetical protein